MNNQFAKKNIASIQVLKTLQVLLEDNYTMTDLITKLNSNEKKAVFNHSVISKYINTCRYIGIDIPKIHNKYFVASLPFGLNLSTKDLELIGELINIANDTLSERLIKGFNCFIEKLNKYSNKQIAKVVNTDVKILYEYFDKAIQEKRFIRLILNDENFIDCIPIEIVDNKGKLFFSVFYDDTEKLVPKNKVKGIEILNKHILKPYSGPVVIFKLTKNLAKRYSLRENEQIISSEEDCITVSNKGENKLILFSRLLRYDSCCEILHPKSYREEMKQLLKNMLDNYEV